MNKVMYFLAGVVTGVVGLLLFIKKIIVTVLRTRIGGDVLIPHIRNTMSDTMKYALYGDRRSRKRYCSYPKYTREYEPYKKDEERSA